MRLGTSFVLASTYNAGCLQVELCEVGAGIHVIGIQGDGTFEFAA